MEVVRLLPGDDRSWPLMPEFFRRARGFVEKYLPETNPVLVIDDLKKRWLETPFLTGYFLVFDNGGLPFAHMTSWIAESYGRPYVFIYQAYCNKFSQLGPSAEAVLKQVDVWAKQLNSAIRPENWIRKFEMSTWRQENVWI